MSLDVGYYTNIFPVEFSTNSASLMITERSKYPDLRSLRDEVEGSKQQVSVYSEGKVIFGYGDDMAWLQCKGFAPEEVNLYETPRLTGRMVLEGFIAEVVKYGGTPLFGKGRCRIFNWDKYRPTSKDEVRVHSGFDVRSIFLRNPDTGDLFYSLIIDIAYALRDPEGQPLNSHQISIRYGSNTFREVRQLQGDIIPTGINSEVSRQRFLSQIIPSVRKYCEFELPCGVAAEITAEPCRVIVGDRE
jgi:hypothetical protein